MSCEGVVHLRRANPSDARAIAEVHVRSWRHAYRDQLPQSFLDALDVPRRESFWRSEIDVLGPDNRPWVADAEGRVVGFVSVGPTRDDDAPVRTGEVYAIYVDPECWERGIGRNLLAHAMRDLRTHGYDRASLWILELNEQARRFYDAGGWSNDGGTKTDTIGGVDVAEVRYVRSLD
jgi:ribosomal protein S18 acetylase RimI-like enzyme